MTAEQSRDTQRLDQIARALQEHELDAVVCSLPSHVLMVSGYFPVVGTSIAIATKERRVLLIVPQDEAELADEGYADEIITYKPEQLDRISNVAESAVEPLREAGRKMGIQLAQVGFEFGPVSEPASYSAMNLFAGAIRSMLAEAMEGASLVPADPMLAKLAAIKTPREVERIRTSCQLAGNAFHRGSEQFRVGMSEPQAAVLVRDGFSVWAPEYGGERADGFAWCMSGPNSAQAAAAYARSRNRRFEAGDLVLLHANSNVGGYWTDITRTYVLGQPDERKQELYAAIFRAREAAFNAIYPGARACDVDESARASLAQDGLAQQFKHSTGHGVGFSAISANALPRIHPGSKEKLQQGMVFNIEPAVYIDGYGGLRHCDMVAVAEKGFDLLTSFQTNLHELTLRG